VTTAPLNPVPEALASRQEMAPVGASHTAETPAHRKLRKAAQDFESLLISELWQKYQASSSWSGETQTAGSDTLNSLAIQTMSVTLAHRGGLGIAQMLVHQLEPSLNRSGVGQTGIRIKTPSSD
jgi:Rod binding domain-containing protein